MGLLTVLPRAVDPTRTSDARLPGARFRGARRAPLLVGAALIAGLAACGDGGTGVPAPPGAPGGLTVTALSVSEVRLDWSDPEGAERIEIERAVEGGDFATRASVGAGTERFQDAGLDPDTRYRYRIRGCNEGGCSSFTSASQATTLAELAVVTTGLPLAVQGRSYDQQLEASGGDGEYTWSADAATLPAGLSLAASGALTGTPSGTGTFEIDVEVESGDGQSAAGPVTVDVNPELRITTTSLPDGERDVAYQATLAATGGDGTFAWSADEATLPEGLTLSEGGELSGTPTEGGDFAVEVEVGSGDGQTAAATLDLLVTAPVEVATSSLPDATLGEAYDETLEATGGDGDYTWSLAAGSLPSGLALDADGTISGTPDTEETATFTVRVESGAGDADERELSIAVEDSTEPVSITTSLLAPVVVGGAYAVELRAEGGGGEGTYVWSVVGGSLPAGLTLGPDGTFGGAPTAEGTATFTVRAESQGQAAQTDLELRVVPDDASRFNITAFNVVAVDPSLQPPVDAAIARWEEIITGDLGNTPPVDFFGEIHCGGFGEIANGTSVDDVLVFVNIAPIDGPGSVLGRAGPCGIRGSQIPFVGTLTLDAEDLQVRTDQQVTNLVFHEIGHILGFGTIWDNLGLIDGAQTDDPLFTGTEAVDRWQALGGSDDVPLESEGGPGTQDSHWSEDVFDAEIMTGFSEIAAIPQPVSEVTIGSMTDLGYETDLGAADDYTLPDPSLVAPAAAARAGWDEILREPILMLLPDGSARVLRPTRGGR